MDKVFEANSYSNLIHKYLTKYKYDQIHPNKGGITTNYPNNYKKLSKVLPKNGQSDFDQYGKPNQGTRLRFELKGQSGFLRQVLIKTTMSCNAAATFALPENLTDLMYDRSTLSQNGVVVASCPSTYSIIRMNEASDEVYNDLTSTTVTTQFFGNQTVELYTILFFMFTDKSVNNLCMDVTRNLTLETTWTDLVDELVIDQNDPDANPAVITKCKCEAVLVTEHFDNDYMSQYLSAGITREWFGYDVVSQRITNQNDTPLVFDNIKMDCLMNGFSIVGFTIDGNLIVFDKVEIYIGGILAQELTNRDLMFLRDKNGENQPSLVWYAGSNKRDGFRGGLDLSQGMVMIKAYPADGTAGDWVCDLNVEVFKMYNQQHDGRIDARALLH